MELGCGCSTTEATKAVAAWAWIERKTVSEGEEEPGVLPGADGPTGGSEGPPPSGCATT